MTLLFLLQLLVLGPLLNGIAPSPAIQGLPAQQTVCNGQWYRIQVGDSWSVLSRRTGLSVAALKAANPEAAAHPEGWLIVGEQLCLPAQPGTGTGVWITVRRGDSWSILANRFGINIDQLQAANPQAMRPNEVLRTGDRIWIPGTAAFQVQRPCAPELAAYGPASADVLTEASGILESLRAYLASCGTITGARGIVETAALTGSETPDIIAVLFDPQEDRDPVGILVVLSANTMGWHVVYQSGPMAGIKVLETNDLNDDGQPDLAWTDTTCGKDSCFTTAHILSFVDGEPLNWIDGSTTMAEAAVRLQDVLPEGTGQELILSGGVIPAVQAGPQRPMTTTWASPGGGPYQAVDRAYAPSFCLYHHIQSANQAFLEGRADNFAESIAGYRNAADDPRLVACWIRPHELEELRAFSLYRLAVAHAYAGDLDSAAATIAELATRYPDDPYVDLASLWWTVYQPTRDARAACVTVSVFARNNPDTWQRLAQWGYANPDMTPTDLCPVVPPG
jgi:LysM repeat protein